MAKLAKFSDEANEAIEALAERLYTGSPNPLVDCDTECMFSTTSSVLKWVDCLEAANVEVCSHTIRKLGLAILEVKKNRECLAICRS